MTDMTARQADPGIWAARVAHPVFARIFPRLSRAMEGGGMAARRGPLLAALTGQVIDIGAGTGSSFSHYPRGVERVVAVEPEPRLRQIATAAARDDWPLAGGLGTGRLHTSLPAGLACSGGTWR